MVDLKDPGKIFVYDFTEFFWHVLLLSHYNPDYKGQKDGTFKMAQRFGHREKDNHGHNDCTENK